MSCCPSAPGIVVGEDFSNEPTAGPEAQRRPGESEDCYHARHGNVSETGRVDVKTEAMPGRIKNNSVFTDPNRNVDIQFEITSGETATYVFTPSSFAGVTMSSSGHMVGQFDSSLENQKLSLRVQATFPGGSDDRTYSFAPGGGAGEDTIRLQHPLPGSIMTSGFGPRKSPTPGASSEHMALDFAYGGGVTKDVLCAYDGEVVLARPGQGYGNYVMIKHVNGAGKHLITTLYAHLDSIYVAVGQKVGGGQKIGKEGNSGIGTGAHLHFEVRLPNNTRVDPTPYLNGDVKIANSVTENNQPADPNDTTTVNNDARVTPAGVEASSSCPDFGSSYPADPNPDAPPPTGSTTPPAVGADPFEKAWYFTMLSEVNSKWMSTPQRSPSDPDVSAGKIDTADQRQRVGWVDHPQDPGGKTKFGVAQRYNPSLRMEQAPYEACRSTGYNKYWTVAPNCSSMSSTKLAVMIFDIKYAMGAGVASKLMSEAGVTGNETGSAETDGLDKLAAARLAYYKSRSGWPTFGRGWEARVNASLAYAKGLS